jgi:hypothetical protein
MDTDRSTPVRSDVPAGTVTAYAYVDGAAAEASRNDWSIEPCFADTSRSTPGSTSGYVAVEPETEAADADEAQQPKRDRRSPPGAGRRRRPPPWEPSVSGVSGRDP